MFAWSDYRVCVTGGAGFLGKQVCRELLRRGLIPDRLFIPRRKQYDLTKPADVERLFHDARPDIIIHLAAEVGGIGANQANPGRYFYANLTMGINLVEQARLAGIRKFVHTGTVCAYPKFTEVPFREDDLWLGYPEETNAPYGVAKKAIFVMLDAYRRQYGLASSVVVPVNLYGPEDNFDLNTSHVIPALIRKFDSARQASAGQVVCWGSGSASREFLFVEDAARGIVAAAEAMDDPVPINLGSGREVSIRELARLIAEQCDYQGETVWDTSRPDGQPRRCLDTSRAEQLLNWQATVPLEVGLRTTVAWWQGIRDQKPASMAGSLV